MNRIIGLVIALVVGGLLVGGLLIPSIEAIQTNVGDEIKITNDSTIVLREIEPGDVLKCTSTYDTVSHNAWTLNDEPITTLTAGSVNWNVGVMSDGYYMQILASTNSNMATWYEVASTSATVHYVNSANETNTLRTYTITFGEDTITAVYDDGAGNTPTNTFDYSWGYTICPYGEGEYCAPVTNGVGLVKNPNQVILCGAYTSGDLDTMYYYKDGQTYVSNTAYTMTADITTELHTGTTDIYDVTVSVVMSDGTNDETFTPYRVLLPYEITGHESSGTYFVMFGVISILGIVALVVVAANGIRNKY